MDAQQGPLDSKKSEFYTLATNVTVSLPKCDVLLRKCDESQSNDCESVTQVDQSQQKSDIITNNSSNTRLQSKIMSISGIFDALRTAAHNMEWKQFSLPADYLKNLHLDVSTAESDSSHRNIDEIHGNGNDSVKLPLRKCYYCMKICANYDIVSCNFCPAHFHMNCLNPPLSCIPDVKWMCPLHPEHFLSKIMTRSYSISQLTFWWKKLAASNDDHSVLEQFIEKTKSSKKKRGTTKMVATQSVKIPEIVKYLYEHSATSPSLLQMLKDPSIRNLKLVRNRAKPWKPRKFLIRRRALDASKKPNLRAHSSEESLIQIVYDDRNRGVAAMPDGNAKYEDLSLWDTKNQRFKFTSHGIYDTDLTEGTNQPSYPSEVNTSAYRQAESNPAPVCTEKAELLNDVNSSWKKIKEIVTAGIERLINEGNLDGIQKEDLDLLKKHLIGRKLYLISRHFPPSFVPDTPPYPFSQHNYLPKYKEVHAAVCPLSHYAPPAYMYQNQLKVGTDISSDVWLPRYGDCEFVSDHHATIFYDEFTNMYELINYSEFNCVVDGVCYTNNVLGKPSKTNVCACKSSSNGANAPVNGDCDRKVVLPTPVNAVQEVPKSSARTSSTSNRKKQMPRRDTQQKLMSEIEKLITKPQKEMTAIANEDLNDIAKVLKCRKPTNGTNSRAEEVQKNPQPVYIIKRKRRKIPNRLGRSFSKNTEENLEPECAERSLGAERAVEVAPVVQSNSEKSPQCSTIEVDGASPKRKRQKLSSENVLNEPIEHLENENSCQYYVEAVNEDDGNEAKCQCRVFNSKFPIGGDSSWEKSAILRHGSHIKLGCLEFVFSIINAVPAPEERLSEPTEISPSVEKCYSPPKTSFSDGGLKRRTRDSDLSRKLTSILSVLSSDRKGCDESSSSTSAVPSSTASDEKTRGTAGSMSTFEHGSNGSDETNSVSSYPGSTDSA